jgi:gentisate 1,2-dioxygenase
VGSAACAGAAVAEHALPPALWKYAEVRPFLMRAGELITAEEAVRRVLILENPGLRGQSCITQSLYAGLQLIMPGEVAPSHRHTQSALRFIVEGQGAFTAVDGERTQMRPATSSSRRAGPGTTTATKAAIRYPVVWLDGLDIPMLRFFDAGFAEKRRRQTQEVTKPEGISFAPLRRTTWLPVRTTRPSAQTSPIFSYPYERTREALHQLETHADVDAWDGVKLRYVNPAHRRLAHAHHGDLHAAPAGRLCRQALAPDRWRRVQRGRGQRAPSIIERNGEQRYAFELRPARPFRDSVVAHCAIRSAQGCVLFSFSDRPVHQALGIHREERLS